MFGREHMVAQAFAGTESGNATPTKNGNVELLATAITIDERRHGDSWRGPTAPASATEPGWYCALGVP
jgi:hypothetical protein